MQAVNWLENLKHRKYHSVGTDDQNFHTDRFQAGTGLLETLYFH